MRDSGSVGWPSVHYNDQKVEIFVVLSGVDRRSVLLHTVDMLTPQCQRDSYS